jgi:lysozyme
MTYPDYAVVRSAQGLDVSSYQGQFDWAAAKARIPGLAFGIYKMTEGLTITDPDAKHNHDGIRAAGLLHGSYHFLHPDLDGAAQARFYLDRHAAAGLDAADMLWLDHETLKKGVTPAMAAACARDFMTELTSHRRHNPHGVYTYIDYAREGYCAGLGRYDLWLAYPSSQAPAEPPPWFGPRFRFWQWGTRNGVDADAFMGAEADLRAWLASFAAAPGPFRHVADGTQTAQEIATGRGTTAGHLAAVSAGAYTAADLGAAASLPLPAGLPYYTSRP